MFANTLTADGNYPVQYCEKLELAIEMQLSRKKKFSQLSVPFLESIQISNILEKKMMVIANVFTKLRTVKNFVTPLRTTRRFGTRLDSRHVKVSRTLAKSS